MNRNGSTVDVNASLQVVQHIYVCITEYIFPASALRTLDLLHRPVLPFSADR